MEPNRVNGHPIRCQALTLRSSGTRPGRIVLLERESYFFNRFIVARQSRSTATEYDAELIDASYFDEADEARADFNKRVMRGY